MKNLRKYGGEPFDVAVLHGGPGAPGEMAPVARELSFTCGIIEPLQKATRLEGQVQELKGILENNGAIPLILIGFSWGAMLGFIFAARYPSYVKKLILISSGVYDEKYTISITKTRLSRLSEEEREEALSLIKVLDTTTRSNNNRFMARLGTLFSKADALYPLTLQSEALEIQYHVYKNVWKDILELRSSGKLLAMGKEIRCSVVALHGDYDPHPREGIEEPLSTVLKDFRFILLEHCGHRPWIEKEAKNNFYTVLKEELK